MTNESEPTPTFTQLLELEKDDRVRHELEILEELMAQATKEKKYEAALKIFESAQRMLKWHGKY